MRRVSRLAYQLAILCGAAGCLAHRGRVAPSGCRRVEGRLDRGASAAGLAGEYRVTLVATRGAQTGRVAAGRLWLRPQDSTLRSVLGPGGAREPNVVMPLFGATDVDVALVGGLRLGDLMSLDPMRPGVAVLERHGAAAGVAFTEITVRLGSEANRRGVVRFDGGYLALYVGQVTDGGFAGTWASGVTGPESEGYFCAVRVGA